MLIYRDLILNVAILLALSQVYSYLLRFHPKDSWSRKLVIGLLFGGISVIGMSVPFKYQDGIIFDGRSAILSMAGYFGGWQIAGISALIATGYRLFLGGSGAVPGVGLIVTSSVLGVGFRYLCRKYPRFRTPFFFYLLGILVHMSMLGWMLVLPEGVRGAVARSLAWPVVLIFPLTTLLLAVLLNDQEKYLSAQVEIIENESRYRALFDNNSSVILIIDPETVDIVDANQAACTFYGWPYAQLTRMKITEINVQSEAEVIAEWENASIEKRDYFYFTHRLANGDIRHVEVYSGPIEMQDQKLLYSIIHDITPRRKAELDLGASQQRFRDLLENVEMIAVMLNEDGQITFCNQYLLDISGWQRDEIMGNSWFDVFIPQDIKEDLLETVFLKTFQNGEVKAHHINDIVTKAGLRRTISWNNTVFRNHHGQVTGATSLGDDITERNQAVDALRQSERMLANAQRLAQIGSWEWDIASGNIEWTEEVYNIFNLDPQTFSPHIDKINNLFHPGHRQIFSEALDQARSRQESFDFEAIIFWPDGSQRAIISTSEGYWDHHDKLILITGTFQDITDRKTNEQELIQHRHNLEDYVTERTAELAERMQHVEQLNQGMVNLMQDLQVANQRTAETARRLSVVNTELESFAYSVSHDLRAPLRSISGFAQILAERHREELDKQGRQYIDYVVQASIQMGRLIDDLLQYSRLGRRALQVRPLDAAMVLDEVIKDLQEQVHKSQAKIEIPGTLPVIDTNHTLLKQIFMNLIQNALIYTQVDQHPEIEVACQVDSEYAIITVRDNGIGIAEEYFDSIFNMFQRLHHDDEYTGTGIGLALVKKAVTLLKGEIWVESTFEEGSTFWVKLPLSQDEGD
jgi:PAS domain S-box-containing protein